MPRVPTADIGGVAPSGSPIQVDASPEMFGATIGQGLQRLGGTLDQAGDMLAAHAVKFQDLDNVAAAQAAAVKTFDQARDTLWNPDGGFYTQTGKNAVDAYAPTLQKLQQIQQANSDGLANPVQKRLYYDEVMVQLKREEDSMSAHAAQQRRSYQAQTSEAYTQSMLNNVATYYNDPARVEPSIGQGLAEIRGFGADTGAPQGETDLRAQNFASTARRAVVERMAVTDPLAAQQYRRDHLSDFTAADNLALDQRLKDEVSTRTALEAVDQAVTGTASPGIGFQNNVANLRSSDAAWDGKGTPVNGFETFATPELGVRAAAKNIQTIASRAGGSITLGDLIAQWAPANDKNNVPAYVASVAQDTGLAPGDNVPTKDPTQLANLLKAMTKVEKGTVLFGDPTYLAGTRSAIDGTALPVPAAHPTSTELAQNLPQLLDQVRSDTASLTPEAQLAAEKELVQRVAEQHQVETLTSEGQAKNAVSLVTAATAGLDPDTALVNQTKVVSQLLTGHDDALKMATTMLEAQHAQAKTLVQAQVNAAHQTLMNAALPADGSRPADVGALLQDPNVKAAYGAATAEGRLGFLSLLRQNAEGTQPPPSDQAMGTYYQLKGQAAADPDGFSKVNLMDPKIVDVLPRNLALDLMNEQARLQTADARNANRSQNLSHAMELIKPMASAAGLNVSPKKDTPDEATLLQLTGRLSDAISTFQADNKRLPNDGEVKEMGRSLLVAGFQRGTAGWFSGDRPAYPFQVPKPSDFYPDVPADARAGLSAALSSKLGRPPTEQEIQTYYMAGKAKGMIQ